MRPKAAQLLALFLANPNRLLTKDAIFNAVWGQVQVQDHVLFQVISEVRKLKPDAELIRTQPNAGYIWVAPVRTAKFSLPQLALAACAGVALSSVSLMFFNQDSLKPSHLLPALSAYANGVQALEAGEAERASDLFRFALSQNPDSEEAGLLLAESLYQAGQKTAAQKQIQTLEQMTNFSDYGRLALADLQSRIYADSGEIQQASEVILHSIEKQGQIAQCTIDSLEKRLAGFEPTLTFGHDAVNSSLKEKIAEPQLLTHSISTDPEVSLLCKELNSKLEQPFEAECDSVSDGWQGQFLAQRQVYARRLRV